MRRSMLVPLGFALLRILQLGSVPAAASLCEKYQESPRWIGSYEFYGASDVVLVEGDVAYLAGRGNPELRVVNIADPSHPREIASFDLKGSGNVWSMTRAGHLLIVAAASTGVHILDVSDLGSIRSVATLHFTSAASGVAVQGDLLCVAAGLAGVQLFQIRDPCGPVPLATINVPGSAWDVEWVGDYVYATGRTTGLHIIDVTDPAAPQIVSGIATPSSTINVEVEGGIAYVTDRDTGLHLFDISNPANPLELSSLTLAPMTWDVTVVANVAWVSVLSEGVKAVDVSDPQAPRLIASVNTPGVAYSAAWRNSTLFVANDNYFNLQIYDVSMIATPPLQATVEMPGIIHRLAAGGEHIYALVAGHGVRVVDHSVPGAPVVVGDLAVAGSLADIEWAPGRLYVVIRPTHGSCLLREMDVTSPGEPAPLRDVIVTCQTQGVAVVGTLALLACGGYTETGTPFGGLRVIDLAAAPTPAILGEVSLPAFVYDVTASGDVAYLAAGLDGLCIVDISDPTAPRVKGTLDTEWCAMRVQVDRDVAYIACDYTGLLMVDVAEPANPTLLGVLPTPGRALAVAVDRGLAYVADAGASPTVGDVGDPAAPVHLGSVPVPGESVDILLHNDRVVTASRPAGLVFALPQCPLATGIPPPPSTASSTSLATNGFSLAAIHPNPLNPCATVVFESDGDRRLQLGVYSLNGRRIAALADQVFPSGRHAVMWDGRDASGRDVSSGVYVLRLSAGGRHVSRRLALVR